MKIDLKESEREKIVKLVRKWGSSTSDAVLDLHCKHYTLDGIEGLVPYRLESNCAVVFGDPICSFEDMPTLVKSFHDHCKKNKNSIVYVIATKKFASWAINNVCSSMIEFGEELFLRPCKDDPKEGAEGALLRKKLRRAEREGVKVAEYTNNDPILEKKIEDMANSWLLGRRGPQVYISHVSLFKDRFGKRWFYAKKAEEIIGMALLNKIEGRGGWVLSQVIISPNASIGTSELLVSSAIDALAKEASFYISFGAVPAQKLGDIQGLRKFSSWLIKFVFKLSRKLFHFDGKKVFWQKFQPKGEPAYVLFGESNIKINDILGLIKAVNMSL